MTNGSNSYEIDGVEHKVNKGENWYLVRWKGFESEFDEWKSEEEMTKTAIGALREYWKRTKNSGRKYTLT